MRHSEPIATITAPPPFFARLRALRAATPAADRRSRMREAVRGFGLEGRLVFPPAPDDGEG